MVLARSEEMRDLLRSYDPTIGWAYRDGTNPARASVSPRPAPQGAPAPPSSAVASPPTHVAPEQPSSPPAAAGEAEDSSGGAEIELDPSKRGDALNPPRMGTPLPVWGPPSIPTTETGKVGQALAQACFFGSESEIKSLIEAGVDVNSRDADGMTGLHWVASRGGLAAAEALIAAGADVNAATTKEGWTPLHWAARAGREDIARALLMSGAAVAVRNAAGRTPLQMCTSQSVKTLLTAHGGLLDPPVAIEQEVSRTRAAPSEATQVAATEAAMEGRMHEADQDVILREMRRIRQSRSRSPSPLPWDSAAPAQDIAPADSQALAKALSNVSIARAVSPRRARFASVDVSDLLSGDTPVGSIAATVQQAAASCSADAVVAPQ
jgi:hypothetical protein